jgi:hypothetical protein
MVAMMVMMAVPMAAVMNHAVTVVMMAMSARRDDRGHRTERRDRSSGRSSIIVAVIVAAGIGRQGRRSHCNRGRGSNSDCAARHDTHCGVLAHVVPSLETNIDLIKTDRRDRGAANYVFAM